MPFSESIAPPRASPLRRADVDLLLRNIYGTKQAPRVWFHCLEKGLKDLGFTPSKLDPCLFYRGNLIFLVYIDDCILMSPKLTEIEEAIDDLKRAKENFTIDDLGDVDDYLQ